MRARRPVHGRAILTIAVGCTLAAGCEHDRRDIQSGPVEIARVMTRSIGELDGPGSVGRPAAVARAADGSLWVSSEESRSEISVFAPDGSYSRTIGRRGEGPGEFMAIGEIAAVGDSMLVFDSRNRRATMVNVNGEVGRSWTYPRAIVRGKAAGNRVITSGYGRGDSLVMPLHLTSLGNDGSIDFGAAPPGIPIEFYRIQRFVAWTPDGTIVSVPMLDPTIQTWSSEGRLLEEWTPTLDWMPPVETQINFTDEVPYHPALTDIHVDEDGVLWMLIHVNPPDWAESLGEPIMTADGPRFPVDDIDRFYSTRVLAIDLASREMVGSAMFDDTFYRFLGDGSAVAYTEMTSDGPQLSVWELSLASVN